MGVKLAEALEFARARKLGVLTTIRRDGRPQMSNIGYSLDDVCARISITDSRAKTKNLRRDPRALLYVPGDDVWAYAVLDGTVELGDVAKDPNDPVVEDLVSYYRDMRGEEHSDWDEYRRSMVAEGRLIARFYPASAYGILGG